MSKIKFKIKFFNFQIFKFLIKLEDEVLGSRRSEKKLDSKKLSALEKLKKIRAGEKVSN